MAQWAGNRSSACFCNSECPSGSKPYHNYVVQVVDLVWPLLNEPRLYQFSHKTGDRCFWFPETAIPNRTLILSKDNVTFGDFEHAYIVKLEVEDTITLAFDVYRDSFGWNDEDEPIVKNEIPGCDSQWVLAVDAPRLGFANIFPAPAWICTQEEGKEWFLNLAS